MNDRIYIAPHRRLGLDRPRYGLRHLSVLLLACALISGLVYEVLR